jgi:hypothetical protein
MTVSFCIRTLEVDRSDEGRRIRKKLTWWSLDLFRLPWSRCK